MKSALKLPSTLPRAPRLATFVLPLVALGGCAEPVDPYAVSTEPSVEETLPTQFRIDPGSELAARLQTAAAAPGVLARELLLPGEIGFDQERHAAVVARVEGLVAETQARLGDRVERGQLLAVLHSAELARARSAYIGAVHKADLAETSMEREERLWTKQITPEESYLAAKHELEEARLAIRARGQELESYAISEAELVLLSDVHQHDGDDTEDLQLTRFEIRSPIDGVIVAKKAILGEAVEDHTLLFEVAALDTVWVDLQVPSIELAGLATGQRVVVESEALAQEQEARIDYVDPRVDADSQRALARIVLENERGAWRPGLYVTVRARLDARAADLVVPAQSVHHFPGPTEGTGLDRVFVALGDGRWEVREVRIGAVDGERCEVLEGLQPGESVAVGEALLLKSAWLGQGGLEE